MNIYVGSLNPAKVDAVREVLIDHPAFASCDVTGFDAASDASDQPKTLEETVRDAMNRAKAAWKEGGIGLLTEGRVDRKTHTKQAIHMAMIHLKKP